MLSFYLAARKSNVVLLLISSSFRSVWLTPFRAFAASMTRTLSTARMHREGTYNFTSMIHWHMNEFKGNILIKIEQFVAPGLASAVEVYAAIVGACLPTLIPIYRKLRYGHPNTPKDRFLWMASLQLGNYRTGPHLVVGSKDFQKNLTTRKILRLTLTAVVARLASVARANGSLFLLIL